MVGFAGSADLYAVHNCTVVSLFLVFSPFRYRSRSFIYRKLGSVRCNSFVLNFTLMFLSHEHLRSLVTFVPT